MRRGQKVVIKVDGQKYHARYVGKGAYSRVFQVGNRVIYYTREDCAKEVLAMFQYDRMMHLPEIVRHDNVHTARSMWYVYSSPFYRDVRPTDMSAWGLMKRMIKFYDEMWGFYSRQKLYGLYKMRAFVDGMRDEGFPHSVTKALQELVDVSSNCGEQVGFDFHKKNFGVNEYGVLIFRDLVNPLTAS